MHRIFCIQCITQVRFVDWLCICIMLCWTSRLYTSRHLPSWAYTYVFLMIKPTLRCKCGLACSVPIPLTFQSVLSNNVGDVELSLTVEVLCLQLANRLVTALVQIAMALCKLNAHKIMCTLCSQLWRSSGSSCTAWCSTSTSCRNSVDCPRMCNPLAIDANADLQMLDRFSCLTCDGY